VDVLVAQVIDRDGSERAHLLTDVRPGAESSLMNGPGRWVELDAQRSPDAIAMLERPTRGTASILYPCISIWLHQVAPGPSHLLRRMSNQPLARCPPKKQSHHPLVAVHDRVFGPYPEPTPM
jgi:hypothetical protein